MVPQSSLPKNEAYAKIRKNLIKKRKEYKRKSASRCRKVMASFFFNSGGKESKRDGIGASNGGDSNRALASPSFVPHHNDEED